MNVLWKNWHKVSPAQLERMDAFWGDGAWRNTLYRKPLGLFPGFDDLEEKLPNEGVAAAYRKRCKKLPASDTCRNRYNEEHLWRCYLFSLLCITKRSRRGKESSTPY